MPFFKSLFFHIIFVLQNTEGQADDNVYQLWFWFDSYTLVNVTNKNR